MWPVCVFSYFRSLIEQFEVQLQQYRQQIEELENHLTTQSSGSHITPQGKNTMVDITLVMLKLRLIIVLHVSLRFKINADLFKMQLIFVIASIPFLLKYIKCVLRHYSCFCFQI